MWLDNHCHLTTCKAEPAEVVAAAAAAGVTKLITVGCSVEDSRQAIAIASQFDNVWATAGVHPHDAKDGTEGLRELLEGDNTAGNGVVAVGECGFDYHYNHSPKTEQQECFEYQIALAHEYDLALVIHSRDAWDDTFAVLDAQGVPERTVFHCFTGGPAEAELALERNIKISFSGIVTFGSATDLKEAARITPLSEMLVETDSPFLAPEPQRGKPNQPSNVAIVGEYIADLLDLDVAEVAQATTKNAHQLYQLGE